MLDAFLFNLKGELKYNLVRKKLTGLEKAVLILTAACMILCTVMLIDNSLLWGILSIVSMIALFVLICIKVSRKNSDKGSQEDRNVTVFQPTKWFIVHRVDIVKEMLHPDKTGLAPSKCVDLLLTECDSKLKSTQPSEIMRKRLKPVGALITIVGISLVTAWLNNMLPGENISYEGSLSQHILSVMKVLANDITLSRTLMVQFVAICIYATVIYIAVVFIIFPVLEKLVDYKFVLTAELKDVLLYIKYDDSFVDNLTQDKIKTPKS